MAGRKSNVLKSREETKPKPAKRQRQSTGLNALAAAEDQFPTKAKFRPHRFGEVEDFSKRKRDYDDDDSENKRRRTEEDEDEDLSGRGSDSEGHEWKVGQVDSDDDSDIDSDEALGSSDEERFEGFTFRGSSKPHAKSKPKAAKRKEINLSEDDASDHEEDDDNDSLGEDAVDLATAWDMNAQEDSDEDDANNTSKGKLSTKDASSESDLGDSEDEESDIDSDTDLSMSDDDKAGTKDGLSKLRDFVSSMETTKPRERSTKSNRGQENVAPTEYGLTPSRKLTVSDLMASGMDSRLKSSLKHLDSAVPSKDPKVGSNGKLTAPLPKRQQDRIDRAAAYDKSKETLNRWIGTVKSNREAEHISFPLPDPYEQQVSRLGPVAPKTDLESTIQSILVESGLATSEKATETQLQAAEDLQTRKMSLEEVQARTAELRKRRDLLFREEIRAKRIKKIKSKSYRRVHRRERQKMEELEQQALIDAGVDPDEKEREQYDRLRAEARMSTKHKDSKWAKSLKQTGRTAWDEDARASMTDLARRDEELQRRMEGRSVRTNEDDYLGSSSSESGDENDAWDEEDSDFESRKLNGDLDTVGGGGSGESTGPHSKLLSMAFMQRAEASRKQQNDDEIKNIRKELNGDVSGSDSEQEGGRKKFGTSKPETGKGSVASRKKNEFEETVGSEDEDFRNETTKEPDNTTLSKKNKKSKSGTGVKTTKSTGLMAATRSAPETEEAVENPWLVQNTRNNRKRDVGEADQALEISVAAPIDESTSRKPESQSAKSRTNRAAPQHDDESSDSDDNAPVLLKNHDLVKRAFAGDDVIAEFKKEKEEVIEEEGDKIVDNTLPGWGSWTGAGVSKKQQKRQKRFLTKVEGVRPEQRKDARLGHVIINEKRVKKVFSSLGLYSLCLYPLVRKANIIDP
jgi:U3 small nucleolar RNA-associated protein 14